MPLNTEDLDFLIEGASGAELRGIIECVVAAIAKVPEVQVWKLPESKSVPRCGSLR